MFYQARHNNDINVILYRPTFRTEANLDINQSHSHACAVVCDLLSKHCCTDVGELIEPVTVT